MHPIVLDELAREHLKDIMTEARHHRLIPRARPPGPGRVALALANLGRVMIAVGRRLQRPAERQESPVASRHEWRQSHP
jgi:precorrin-6B methylase 1